MTMLERISTGNAQLDDILGGGFPRNSINIVMGEPGSGKTILVERLAFANASDDRPILYLTTLSEPLDEIVRYLQQFEFYDESKLMGAIAYESLGEELASKGIAAVVPKLKEAIRSLSPKIIVIDSFKAIHDLTDSAPEMRRMLYELSGLLTAYDTTCFLIGEYSEDQIRIFPEFAVADGIVELTRKKHGMRDERHLRVLKLRGSAYVEGFHAFRITSKGLDVFPRLVSPTKTPSYESLRSRAPVGIESVDRMLGGGMWRGSTTILEGPTGAGKTTFALQFALAGVERGEPSLYVNFQENPTQLARAVANLGMDVTRKNLHLLYRSAVELPIDSIVTEIFQTIQTHQVKRVVIDAVGDLLNASGDVTRLRSYLYALCQHFVANGITSILTWETSPTQGTDTRFSALCDALMVLDIDLKNGPRRTFRIAKARGIAHDLEPREFRITDKGFELSR